MENTMVIAYHKPAEAPLSTNFMLSEFQCPCSHANCTVSLVSTILIEKLQRCRDKAGAIKINSGYRCGPHNASVGESSHSYHLFGMAADIRALDISQEKLLKIVDEEFVDAGLIVYKTHLHVDVRFSRFRA